MSEPLEALPCLSQSAVASVTHAGDVGFLQFGTNKRRRRRKRKKEKRKKKKKGYKKGRKAEEEIDAEGITVIQIETWRDLAALNFYTRRQHKGTSFNFERAHGDTTSENGD